MADVKKDNPPVAPVLSSEIEIEFGDERNRVFLWGPGGQVMLRGTWSRKNLRSDELVEEVANMPDIPGQRIRLNIGRKTAVIYDPLATEKNKELCEKIQDLIFRRFRRKEGPAKEVIIKDMDADDLKTWLYWMWRHVSADKARVTAGDMPTPEEIEKMPGRTRMSMFDSSSRACKWHQEYQRFTDAILTLARQPIMA